MELFDNDTDKVKALDKMIAEKMGFDSCFAVSGQTYSRKLDYQMLTVLCGIAMSATKFSNDIRLLQHMKEIEEPFEKHQIGSSAMAYKRNPMRSLALAIYHSGHTEHGDDLRRAVVRTHARRLGKQASERPRGVPRRRRSTRPVHQCCGRTRSISEDDREAPA